MSTPRMGKRKYCKRIHPRDIGGDNTPGKPPDEPTDAPPFSEPKVAEMQATLEAMKSAREQREGRLGL